MDGLQMIRRLLRLLGYRIEYVSEWGVHSHRYDGADSWMGRPIHPDMSVAPPWAKRRIVKDSQ
jgi:hypothetical protein